MNSENWLKMVTKGKMDVNGSISLDRRRELPDILRVRADEGDQIDKPVILALTPTAARILANDIQLAVILNPDARNIADIDVEKPS